MPRYTVTFFKPDGLVGHVQDIEAPHDDAILDAVGESSHPDAIHVHEGERLIGAFAPQNGRRPDPRPDPGAK